MGKFVEALKKSERVSKDSPRYNLLEESFAKMSSSDEIERLRLDTAPSNPEKDKVRTASTANMDERLKAFLNPSSMASECFKLLRAKILTLNKESRPRSIMITSPQPVDGKTTIATNLAINIAQGINEHVLLVDCDLRRPSVDKLLGIHAKQGLSEYLKQDVSVASYLLKTPIEKLQLLPSGRPPSNPSELLASEKMQRLVEELKTRYEDRYVIYDATPAQFAAETTTLSSKIDAVLLVVRAGQTTHMMISEAIENIGRKKILGVVFNASYQPFHDYQMYYRYYQK